MKKYEEGKKKYANPTLKILDEDYLKWGDELDNGKYLLNDNSDSLAKEQSNKKGESLFSELPLLIDMETYKR